MALRESNQKLDNDDNDDDDYVDAIYDRNLDLNEKYKSDIQMISLNQSIKSLENAIKKSFPKYFVLKIAIPILIINILLLKMEFIIQLFFINKIPNDHTFYESMEPIFKFLASISTIFILIFLLNISLGLITLLSIYKKNYYFTQLLIILHLISFIVTFFIGTIGHGTWLLIRYLNFKYIYSSLAINIISFISVILLSTLSSFLSLIFFIKMKFYYIKDLKTVSLRV